MENHEVLPNQPKEMPKYMDLFDGDSEKCEQAKGLVEFYATFHIGGCLMIPWDMITGRLDKFEKKVSRLATLFGKDFQEVGYLLDEVKMMVDASPDFDPDIDQHTDDLVYILEGVGNLKNLEGKTNGANLYPIDEDSSKLVHFAAAVMNEMKRK